MQTKQKIKTTTLKNLAKDLNIANCADYYVEAINKNQSFDCALRPQHDCSIYLILDGNIDLNLEIHLEKDLTIQLFILSLLDKAKKQNINIKSKVTASDCNYAINTLAFLKRNANRRIFFNTNVSRDAKNAKVAEKDEVIMLDKDARNTSIPALCSNEDSADCTHKFYSGKIDQAQLDFLAARNIQKEKALLLLNKSKIPQVMQKYFLTNFKS